MTANQTISTGDTVSFKPGPKSSSKVSAKVIGVADNGYLITKDSTGKERKIRPGACSKVN